MHRVVLLEACTALGLSYLEKHLQACAKSVLKLHKTELNRKAQGAGTQRGERGRGGFTSCRLMMALWGLSMSQSSFARSSPAPATWRARASREAVVAASKCPLTLHSLACCSQHCPASASAPLTTASCLLNARIGSCNNSSGGPHRSCITTASCLLNAGIGSCEHSSGAVHRPCISAGQLL